MSIWFYGVILGQFHPILTKDLAELEPTIFIAAPTWQTWLVVLKDFKHICITNLWAVVKPCYSNCKERKDASTYTARQLILTVNSVTWIELEAGPKIPASLYISRIKATHVVDFPSLYTHSSCSGIVSSWSKVKPRFSVSARIPSKSKSWSKPNRWKCSIRWDLQKIAKMLQGNSIHVLLNIYKHNSDHSFCTEQKLELLLSSLMTTLI